MLSREDEHDLALKYYETGDKEILHTLVTANLRFVVKIAFEYIHYRLKLLDLIQEGNMGLVKAVRDFNPYKDVRITTYAVWWIRSYIQDAILKNFSLVKMGTTQAQKKLFYRLRKEQAKLEKMGIVPAERTKLLAANLDVKEKEVQEMQQRLAGPELSLNSPIGTEDSATHMDRLVHEQESIDDSLGDAEQLTIFKKILDEFAQSLKGRDRTIFNERLVSESPITLQEIGTRYSISKERARQIEEQIKSKLKTYVAEHYPDYDLLMSQL